PVSLVIGVSVSLGARVAPSTGCGRPLRGNVSLSTSGGGRPLRGDVSLSTSGAGSGRPLRGDVSLSGGCRAFGGVSLSTGGRSPARGLGPFFRPTGRAGSSSLPRAPLKD